MSSIDLYRDRAQDEGAYRGLWGAVVLQAKADIQIEPLGSLEYAHAVAFFTGGGDWVHTRTTIADFLELHRDDLERMGRRCINERRAAEGLEPLPPRSATPVRRRVPQAAVRVPQTAARLPQAATHRPVQVQGPEPAERARREPRPQQGQRFNPFFPKGIYASHLATGA